MHRKFIAVVLAVSISITALSARAASAGDKDLARFLAGLAGLAVIGAIIHEENKDRNTVATTSRTYHQPYKAPSYRPAYKPHHQTHSGYAPRPLPNRVSRKVLPAQCLHAFNTRRGQVNAFGDRCLDRNYRDVRSLPQGCRVDIRTQSGRQSGYDPRCLRQKGYVISRN
jgi:hypothetical protein